MQDPLPDVFFLPVFESVLSQIAYYLNPASVEYAEALPVAGRSLAQWLEVLSVLFCALFTKPAWPDPKYSGHPRI